MSLRNSNSQQSVDSSRSGSQNFQLNWKPGDVVVSSEFQDPRVKHSSHPKPLPPMPQNLPQSESLQQDLKYFHMSRNGQSAGDNDNAGNISEVYDQVKIEIPKLRKKKQVNGNGNANVAANSAAVAEDGELIDSEISMEVEEAPVGLPHEINIEAKMESLKIDESNDSSDLFNDVSKSNSNDVIQSPVAKNTAIAAPSASKFTFSFAAHDSKKDQFTTKFENTVDSVLPPDRTLSTIIKDNHKSYNKFRNRMVSNSSDKYYEDVVLDSVRNSVNHAFDPNRDSIKRFNKDIHKIQEQENESSYGSSEGRGAVSTSATSASDAPSNTAASGDGFTAASGGDFTIADYMHSGYPEKSAEPASRVSSIGAPLGESTQNQEIDVSMEEESKLQKIDESLEKLKKEDFSIRENLPDKDESLGSVFDQSNDSAASNFTLKLIQMKKEKEMSMVDSPKPTFNEQADQTNPNDTARSLAPTRLTNSVLDNLWTKTNEIAAKTGIRDDITGAASDGAPTAPFTQPQFPRSPTQDSLSSTEEVHNIWASIGKKNQASTIRSQSMKSSPSMNSMEIKKMIKTKQKIGSRGGSRKQRAAPPLPKNHERLATQSTNFIDDTIDRVNSDADEEDEIDPDIDVDVDAEGGVANVDPGDEIADHIKDELLKIPQPLLPEQHFGNLEQEFTEEISRFDDNEDSNEVIGYTTKFNNELIVAKLEEKSQIPNEIFNNKKQNTKANVGSRSQVREIKTSHGSSTHYSRKSSRETGVTSSTGATDYISARDSIQSSQFNVRKRKSGNSRELKHDGFRASSGTTKIYERQIQAPKSHKVTALTKRGQSMKATIHDEEDDDASFEAVSPEPAEQVRSAGSPQPEFEVNLPKDDQGRLYVRIVGLKSLDLPAIDQHHAKFSLILDNGIHCISTPSVELGTNTSINQEFELTVSDNLEFILTLKAIYEYEGIEKLIEITERYPVRKRVLGGILGHKTVYKTRTRLVTKVDKADPWDNKMANDGSFARSYVDFAQYEPLITGKACNFDVTCFNEWETFVENGEIHKRQPYRIGKLELQMLYIPRTKVNEMFPPSIHVAYEAVKEYQRQMFVGYEGFLSQEGGDCNYLKRRWFTLNGTDLIAHNEFSKKTRAKINLIKAVGLISSNGKTSYGAVQSQRRVSDDIILHQGFKIRFMNGETIEFVADSQYEKMNWLRALDQVISKNKFRQPWIKILYDQLGE